jgi:enoyl-CoA hydratase/carnithine racemase
MATVKSERDGHVLIVSIHRPEARNAVDRFTAEALAEEFRKFDADDSLFVAVLAGSNGTFCAGADLKAMTRVSECFCPLLRVSLTFLETIGNSKSVGSGR